MTIYSTLYINIISYYYFQIQSTYSDKIMSGNDENDSNMNNDLSKFNLSFYESSIELWRAQEKCRCKYFIKFFS